MSNAAKMIEMGASCVGGSLLYKNKLLGNIVNGDLHLTDEGKAFLAADISDAVIKSETPKKPKKAKVEVVEEAPAPKADDEFDMDSLLAE